MNYKIGDKVRIRTDLEVGKIYGNIVSTLEMYAYRGKETTIHYVKDTYCILDCLRTWIVSEEMLEPVVVVSSVFEKGQWVLIKPTIENKRTLMPMYTTEFARWQIANVISSPYGKLYSLRYKDLHVKRNGEDEVAYFRSCDLEAVGTQPVVAKPKDDGKITIKVDVMEATLPDKVMFNDKKKCTTLLYRNAKGKMDATVVKTMKGDKYKRETGFLMAYFEKNCGMTRTKAKKYLQELTKPATGNGQK